MQSNRLTDYTLSIMHEILALSRGKRVRLPETIITDAYQKGYDFPYETKTSFQRDVERFDKPDERDVFGGVILRLGQQLEIKTPITEEVWRILNKRKALPV